MLTDIGHGLDEAFFMFWETLWALVLGFVLSGAVQAFVSRSRMQRVLGDHSPAALGRASFFGVVSSSCSYAAAALAKTLFARGADFTAAMVFMIASTNLVVELGLVLWLLVGWQFALAEFVGGAIMIVLLGLVLPRLVPRSWADQARAALNTDAPSAHENHHAHHHEHHHEEHAEVADQPRRTWGDAAAYTISDLTMLRKELVIGFVVAGFASALVPTSFWRSLFWTGHGFWSSLENAILGPFLAIISFVCSIGNVPLAAALWGGGIGFGGVVAFVFADLITLPLLAIYRKYYGTALTLRILGTFWVTMTIAGLAVEYLFRAIGIHDPVRHKEIVPTHLSWNYTSILNIIALAGFAVVFWLYRRRGDDTATFAKDPICGMQVEIAHAPAVRTHHGSPVYFCSDHCAHKFDADPDAYAQGDRPSGGHHDCH
ncbi:MAG: permease [Marmoricola sp.]